MGYNGKGIEDHSGMKYGKLTVLKKLCIKNHTSYYLLRCECGNEIVKRVNHLSNAQMCRHCAGEKNGTQKKEKGLNSKNSVIYSNKKGALKRGLGWSLSEEDCEKLFGGNCYLCGRPPQNEFTAVYNNGSSNGSFVYNGIDRIDNSKGYIVGNVRSCCFQCNRAKHKNRLGDFLSWIKLVYIHNFGNEGME